MSVIVYSFPLKGPTP